MTNTETQTLTAADLPALTSDALLALVLSPSSLADAADALLVERIEADKLAAAAAAAGAGVDLGAVRAWALAQGIDISARGRVPHRVVERYLAR